MKRRNLPAGRHEAGHGMEAEAEDRKRGADRDGIPERLQILVARLRKVMLQRPPAGPAARDP